MTNVNMLQSAQNTSAQTSTKSSLHSSSLSPKMLTVVTGYSWH